MWSVFAFIGLPSKSAIDSSGMQITPRKEHDTLPVFDPIRTLRFFAFGFGMGEWSLQSEMSHDVKLYCIPGPLIGRWNFLLERHFPLRLQTTNGTVGNVSLRALSKRVAADQLVMAPTGVNTYPLVSASKMLLITNFF